MVYEHVVFSHFFLLKIGLMKLKSNTKSIRLRGISPEVLDEKSSFKVLTLHSWGDDGDNSVKSRTRSPKAVVSGHLVDFGQRHVSLFYGLFNSYFARFRFLRWICRAELSPNRTSSADDHLDLMKCSQILRMIILGRLARLLPSAISKQLVQLHFVPVQNETNVVSDDLWSIWKKQ